MPPQLTPAAVRKFERIEFAAGCTGPVASDAPVRQIGRMVSYFMVNVPMATVLCERNAPLAGRPIYYLDSDLDR